ncbi:MAG: NAD-binding protein, partial [Gemmatimonadota bacterium]|nr:NAD-binding protein [Gemmatimonadota bacterium]
GVAAVLALIVIVRPLNVFVSTLDADLTRNEAAFLAWLAPRGIVAFAVSSLFATELAHVGMATEGDQLRAMVFLVIAITVVLQGGTGGLVARLLEVRIQKDHGFTIVGANPVGRALAQALREAGPDDTPVVLVDTNPNETHEAQAAGYRVVFGNASDESTLMKAGVEARRTFVALTPNEGVNLLLANRVHEAYPSVSRLVAIDPKDPGVMADQVHENDAFVLFGVGIDHQRWAHELGQNRVEIRPWEYRGPPLGLASIPVLLDAKLPTLALVHRRGGREVPASDAIELRTGDRMWFAWLRDQTDVVTERLIGGGWTPVEAGKKKEEGPA